jgi:hypothetical protein
VKRTYSLFQRMYGFMLINKASKRYMLENAWKTLNTLQMKVDLMSFISIKQIIKNGCLNTNLKKSNKLLRI